MDSTSDSDGSESPPFSITGVAPSVQQDQYLAPNTQIITNDPLLANNDTRIVILSEPIHSFQHDVNNYKPDHIHTPPLNDLASEYNLFHDNDLEPHMPALETTNDAHMHKDFAQNMNDQRGILDATNNEKKLFDLQQYKDFAKNMIPLIQGDYQNNTSGNTSHPHQNNPELDHYGGMSENYAPQVDIHDDESYTESDDEAPPSIQFEARPFLDVEQGPLRGFSQRFIPRRNSLEEAHQNGQRVNAPAPGISSWKDVKNLDSFLTRVYLN